FIDGGGLDCAFLGFAECDGAGNVNASRFSGRIAGCGGFINISQNAEKVVFIGTFAAGHARKICQKVSQVAFRGKIAGDPGKDVRYVTECCVFRLTPGGLALPEIAPGLELERDILAHLPFTPIFRAPATMDPAIFKPEPMGLRARMLDIRIDERLSYDGPTNT